MANSLTAVIGVDSTGFTKGIQDARSLLDKYVADIKKTGTAVNGVTASQVTAYQRVVKSLEKVASGSMENTKAQRELTKQIQELTAQWANLSDEAKNSDFGKTLSASIGQAKDQLNQLSTQISQTKQEMVDMSKSSKTTGGSFKDLAGKLGLNIGMLSKFTGGLTLVTGAMKVVKDTFLSTEDGIDTWGRTVEEAKAAYTVFCTSLNTGNWENFFANLNDAIGGAKELYDSLDRLGSIKVSNKAAIAIVEAELQRLRLLKDEGQNVDSQIKQAEARLRYLKGQEVEEGKEDGFKQIVEAIRNQDRRVSQEEAESLAREYIKYGYDALKSHGTRIERLKKKAGVKTGPGVTSFDGDKINWDNLSKSDQRKLRASMAFVSAESHMASGIDTYAQAEQLGASISRQEHKYNKWTGATGSGKKTPKEEEVVVEGSLTAKERELTEERKKLNNELVIGTEEWKKQFELVSKLDLMLDRLKQGILSEVDVPKFTPGLPDIVAPIKIKFDEKNTKLSTKTIASINKSIEKSLGIRSATYIDDLTSSLTNLGSAFSSLGQIIGEEAGQWVSWAAQSATAIGQVLMQTSQLIVARQAAAIASGTASGAGLPFPANIAAIASIVATIASVFASLPKFAEGGIITGKTGLGDYNLARVNSGEMIINGSQQKRLFSILNGSGVIGSKSNHNPVQFEIKGKNLVGVQRNYNKKQSRL